MHSQENAVVVSQACAAPLQDASSLIDTGYESLHSPAVHIECPTSSAAYADYVINSWLCHMREFLPKTA